MEKPWQETWSEAMTWWKSQDEVTQKMISQVAEKKLIEGGSEEIGSSDLNHSVFSIYRAYVLNDKPDLHNFLFNYS